MDPSPQSPPPARPVIVEAAISSESPVDPRGPRFAAWVTSVVLALVLLSGSGWLLAIQTVIFAAGAFAGLRFSPYALAYRYWVQPRLQPTVDREDTPPLRFAQAVGFAFAVIGLIGYATGVTTLGVVATALALIAALLNAAFGFCLGCQLYLLLRRLQRPAGS